MVEARGQPGPDYASRASRASGELAAVFMITGQIRQRSLFNVFFR